MNNHFALLVSLVLMTFFSALAPADEDAARKVVWELKDAHSIALFARALRKLTSGSFGQVTTCRVTVLRPRMGLPAIKSPENEARCEGDGSAALRWSLAGTRVYAWGNRFSPKGFSLKGQPALALFEALKKVHDSAPADETLTFQDVNLGSPAGNYDFEEYALKDLDPTTDGERISTMNCSKYYYYPANEARPTTPSEIRCDFVYQFTVIKGDTF